MEEFDGQSKPKKLNKKSRVIPFIVILALIGGGIYYDTTMGNGIIKGILTENASSVPTVEIKKKVENKSVVSIESDSKTKFLTFGKGYIQCTKDGIKYFSSFNKQKWSDTFTMISPVVLNEGEFIAVGELMGRTVRVYNQDGFVYKIQADNPILNFCLNKNGYLGIIINNKTQYLTQVYTTSGEQITDRKDSDEGIFPVAVDISDDNKVLAISYLDSTDMELFSKVIFFYINKEDSKDHIDAMFASIEKPGEIVPVLEFMEGDKLVAISDRSIFATNKAGEEKWSFPLTNKINANCFAGKSNIVIANGEVLSGKEGKENGLVEWIDLEGKVVSSFQADEKVNYLKGNKEAVVIGASRHFFAVNKGGKALWEHKAVQDVSDILFMENNNMALYVTKNSAEIVDMSQQNMDNEIKENIKTNKNTIEETDNKLEDNSTENKLENVIPTDEKEDKSKKEEEEATTEKEKEIFEALMKNP